MSRTIYLAGKIGGGEASIEAFAEELRSRGHTILEPWWELGRLPKPYLDYPETSQPAAQRMIVGVMAADIFILFPTDDILGAMSELGAALASRVWDEHKLVIIVGADEVRQSVFYAHPNVTRLQDLDQLLAMPWY